MKAICVDDVAKTLEYTVSRCRELAQIDGVEGFTCAREALEWLKDHPVDIAFLDIDLPDMNGIALAARIKELHPNTAIVFMTAYKDFAFDGMSVCPSGYLLKPLTDENLAEEVEHALREGKDDPSKKCARIEIKTFGNFDVFIDGEMLAFPRSKAKEILAYLVDQQGSGVRRANIYNTLWSGKTYERRQQKYLDVIIGCLKDTLKKAGISQILENKGGLLRVIPENFDCDLFRFIQGDPAAIRAYQGRYMNNYSWAVFGKERVGVGVTDESRERSNSEDTALRE